MEEWRRYALKKGEMKVSRNKAEYMCVNESETGGEVMLQRVEVVRLDEFKELGSEILSHGQCTREVKMRVQAGWRWRLVYKVLMRPAVVHGLETLALTKRQEVELGVAELKMF